VPFPFQSLILVVLTSGGAENARLLDDGPNLHFPGDIDPSFSSASFSISLADDGTGGTSYSPMGGLGGQRSDPGGRHAATSRFQSPAINQYINQSAPERTKHMQHDDAATTHEILDGPPISTHVYPPPRATC